jgi:hypothetical protein
MKNLRARIEKQIPSHGMDGNDLLTRGADGERAEFRAGLHDA